MKLKHLTTATAAIMAAGLSAGAMAASVPQFFVGAQLGHQNIDVEDVSDYGVATETFDYSVNGIAGGVFAGAKFHVTPEFYLAPEINLGTSNADGGDRVNAPAFGYSDSYEFEAGRTYGVSLLAGYNVTNATSLYGRLGYQRTKFEASYSETGEPTVSESETFSGARFGIGMETALSQTVALRLDWSQTHYSSKSYEGEYGERYSYDPTESLFQVGVVVGF